MSVDDISMISGCSASVPSSTDSMRTFSETVKRWLSRDNNDIFTTRMRRTANRDKYQAACTQVSETLAAHHNGQVPNPPRMSLLDKAWAGQAMANVFNDAPMPLRRRYWGAQMEGVWRSSSSRCTLLDGCLNVYLDVGTSVGAQIRKLWEPGFFPLAGVRRHFDEVFGRPRPVKSNNRSSMLWHCPAEDPSCWQHWTCAVGVEPNPAHTQWLQLLEAHYQQQGRRTHILTQTAATTFDGNITLFEPINPSDRTNNAWSASTIMRPRLRNHTAHRVRAIDLARFIETCVARRRLPLVDGRAVPGNVTLKLDIEGQEMTVLPTLYDLKRHRGALCAVSSSMIETHGRPRQGYFNGTQIDHLKRMFRRLQYELPRHKCSKLLKMDDERYSHDPRVTSLRMSRQCYAGNTRLCTDW